MKSFVRAAVIGGFVGALVLLVSGSFWWGLVVSAVGANAWAYFCE